MNTRLRLGAPVLLAFILPGCLHGNEEVMGMDPTWGEANRMTFAAQVVNPEPDYTFDEMETSADHAADAVERYRTGKVKQPAEVDVEAREIPNR